MKSKDQYGKETWLYLAWQTIIISGALWIAYELIYGR